MTYIPCNICGGGVPGSPCRCGTGIPLGWPMPALTGWTCPKCSRVWAPHVDGCRTCNPADRPAPEDGTR